MQNATGLDTEFHRAMPPVAQHYALPPDYAAMGIIRYGFHGLSYEYIMDALRAMDPAAADGRRAPSLPGRSCSCHLAVGEFRRCGLTRLPPKG